MSNSSRFARYVCENSIDSTFLANILIHQNNVIIF